MPIETLNWGSVADWASAFGSMAAVVTALYLANASQKIKLDAWCGYRIVTGGRLPNKDIISIMITNIGSRPATISNIGIRTGIFKKRYAIIKCAPTDFCDGVPKTINDGEQAHYGFLLDNEKTWINNICNDFILNRLDILTLRLTIHCTSGSTKIIKPEKTLLKMITEKLNQVNKNTNHIIN